VRDAQGKLRAAVADFREALDLARRWRLEVIPSDAVRGQFGVNLQNLYSGFIQAAGRLYLATSQPALLRESFEAAEENRAASLRALVTESGDWQRGLPSGVWAAFWRGCEPPKSLCYGANRRPPGPGAAVASA